MNTIELVPATKTDDALPKMMVSAKEAGRMLSLSTRTLYNLRQTGELRAIHVGRSIRFSVEDIKAWIARAAEGKCEDSQNRT
jgi:excisionase family DNA binding protein